MFQSANAMATAAASRGTVLCVESDRPLNEAINSVLCGAGYDTIQVTDAHGALQTIAQHTPDLVLLDVRHCGGDGMDLCRRLRADRRCNRVPLILLSEICDEGDRVLGLELGADDFLPIPFGNRELLARIKSLLRRSKLPPAQVLKHGEIEIDVDCCRAEFRGTSVALTATEFRILQFLAQSPYRVHSRDKIMEAAHLETANAMERSVDPHINTIRRKLGEGGRHIETVRGFGYRLN